MKRNIPDLNRKRRRAGMRILKQVAGSGLASAAPTPALETAKQLGIAVADAWMFWDIYEIYHDEKLSTKKLIDLLGAGGIIVVAGGAVGYGAIKVAQSFLDEVMNVVPVAGWVVSGALTGVSSLTIGLAWWAFVDDSYTSRGRFLAPQSV